MKVMIRLKIIEDNTTKSCWNEKTIIYNGQGLHAILYHNKIRKILHTHLWKKTKDGIVINYKNENKSLWVTMQAYNIKNEKPIRLSNDRILHAARVL